MEQFWNRYGSRKMKAIWSQKSERITWRRIWYGVLQYLYKIGKITEEQLEAAENSRFILNLDLSNEIEEIVKHDLVAEKQTYQAQCPSVAEWIHKGLTSADIKDNADIIHQKRALKIILRLLNQTRIKLEKLVEEKKDRIIIGFTHLQPARPLSLGMRLSVYRNILLEHERRLSKLELRAKGVRGPVGDEKFVADELGITIQDVTQLNIHLAIAFDWRYFPVTSQTYPRIQDYTLLSELAGLAASLHKIALDFRLMQAQGLYKEPFEEMQVGSSAMPEKQNPILCEKICSLSRIVLANSNVAWENAANNMLERTLDDSANRRLVIPTSFLAIEEMLMSMEKVLNGIFS